MSNLPAVTRSTGVRRLPVPALSGARRGTGADPAGMTGPAGVRLARRTTRGRL